MLRIKALCSKCNGSGKYKNKKCMICDGSGVVDTGMFIEDDTMKNDTTKKDTKQ